MPADADVLEDKPGKCPKCGMTLQPIRLVSVWTCASKPGLVAADKPGKCPVDGTALVQMTMAVSWTCSGSTTASISPGTCADGSPMKAQYALRPHGNHNPQHGGQFFMAPDNWHHLEGTYPRAGIFRMYLYDDYTKPLPRAQERRVVGELIVQGQSHPLVLAPNGHYLETKIPPTLPAEMQAKVKFQSDGQPSVFDFTFDTYSKERAATSTWVAKAASTPATSAPASMVSSAIDPALIPLPIPNSTPDIVMQLQTRTEQIRVLIDKGSIGEVYVPAFQAKDLAVALEGHEQELTSEKRPIVDSALAKLVRAAYLLDAFGDLGNKEQISAAFTQFAAAEHDVVAAFPPQ
jgi:hypothetical protein